jgi:hypothetical protein
MPGADVRPDHALRNRVAVDVGVDAGVQVREPCALIRLRDVPVQILELDRDRAQGRVERLEEAVLAREEVAAEAGLDVDDRALKLVGGLQHLLGVGDAAGLAVEAAGGDDQRREDEREHRDDHADGGVGVAAERGASALRAYACRGQRGHRIPR